MSYKIYAILLVVGVSYAADNNVPKSLAGVDPNSLSCDPLGQVFLLLPSFTKCNEFFMCANGREVLFTCPSNTIFDFEQQVCNWEYATECVLRTEPDIEGSGSGDDTVFGVDTLEAAPLLDIIMSNPLSSNLEGHVVKSGSNGILNCHNIETASLHVAYRTDCQRYWRCINGVAQTMYCSDGLFFNPQTQQCDYEANVKCDLSHDDELKGEYIVYNK